MAVDGLIIDERVNAVIGWVMVAIVTLGSAESFLTNAFLWGGFSLLVVAVVSLPALITQDWKMMIPWPLLTVVAIATTARATEFYPEIAGYLVIATAALVVVVELDVFTSVELSRPFAIGFAVLTTMAIEALWIIAQFYSDVLLGTQFLISQTNLQVDIVSVTVVGFAIGGLFYWYVARFDPAGTDFRSSNGGKTP